MRVCQEKFMKLGNSPLGEALRQGRLHQVPSEYEHFLFWTLHLRHFSCIYMYSLFNLMIFLKIKHNIFVLVTFFLFLSLNQSDFEDANPSESQPPGSKSVNQSELSSETETYSNYTSDYTYSTPSQSYDTPSSGFSDSGPVGIRDDDPLQGTATFMNYEFKFCDLNLNYCVFLYVCVQLHVISPYNVICIFVKHRNLLLKYHLIGKMFITNLNLS